MKDFNKLVKAMFPVPTSPPQRPARAACKAFCGLRERDMKPGTAACEAWGQTAIVFWGGTTMDDVGWCTAACRGARLPPLAPQKAAVGAVYKSPCEPMCEMGLCYHCDREFKEADDSMAIAKPASAKAPTPVCVGCRRSPCNRGYLTCAISIEPTIKSTGWPKLPTRLARPRLAHSEGVEDDTLEDVR